ncbi:hypothetical protein FRB94_010062 [Tulasnella sp. JGI-2019a]|nr:hypothetical protein FRB93_007250 [Tulasnella sp. JGI-2019a]KAG8994212.1 hypothetical protein FRB94_010062 [Tulasnella sp. JGI-2019a]
MPTPDLHSDGPYALTLPEIRLQVFEKLTTEDLLNTALVCRAWSWPAIDTTQRITRIKLSWLLAPLVNCTAVKLQECMHPDRIPEIAEGQVTERRDPELAGKITRLVIDLAWKVALAIDMTQLANPLGGPIFPNLLSLEHDIDGPESSDEEADMERWTPVLPLLIGPRVEKLTLTFYCATEQVVEDNIQALAHIALRIHTVVIHNESDVYSPDYSAFSQMTSLTVDGFLNHQTWIRLASCPQLESIVLREDDGVIDNEAENYTVTFPCMKTLTIDHLSLRRDPEFVLELLQGTTMPMLQSLEVSYPKRRWLMGTLSTKNEVSSSMKLDERNRRMGA